MVCMPRLMLRAWCASADLGVHWKGSLLVCTSQVDGARVPRCRVRLASSWARAVWSLKRPGWQSGMGVWLSNSWLLPVLFLAVSAVSVTGAAIRQPARREKRHTQNLDLSVSVQVLVRGTFWHHQNLHPVSAGPSPLGSPCQGWRHPPWYSPRDRGSRAEGGWWDGGMEGGRANMQCFSAGSMTSSREAWGPAGPACAAGVLVGGGTTASGRALAWPYAQPRAQAMQVCCAVPW